MNCPFCQSEVNPGAIVCAHCGATERMVPDTKQMILKVLLPVLAVLIVIGVLLGYFSNLGILALVGLAWWGWRLYRGIPKKSTWIRRVG